MIQILLLLTDVFNTNCISHSYGVHAVETKDDGMHIRHHNLLLATAIYETSYIEHEAVNPSQYHMLGRLFCREP